MFRFLKIEYTVQSSCVKENLWLFPVLAHQRFGARPVVTHGVIKQDARAHSCQHKQSNPEVAREDTDRVPQDGRNEKTLDAEVTDVAWSTV